MQLRKIILTIMASATILGVGANIQPTMIHARRVRTYHYHKHYVQRHRVNKQSKRNHHQRKHLTKQNHLHWRKNHHYKFNKKSRKFRHKRAQTIKKRHHNYRHLKKSKHTRVIKRHRHRIRNKVASSKKPHSNTNNTYNIGVHKIAQILENEDGNSVPMSSELMTAKDAMQNSEPGQTTGDPQIDQIIEEYKQGPVPSSDQLHDSIPHTKLAPQTSYNKAFEAKILYDMDQDRAKNGESPLNVDPKLQHLAELRTPQLALDFSHNDAKNNDADYDNEDDTFGANEAQENIAQGYNTGSINDMTNELNNDLFTREKPSDSNPNGGYHYQAIMNNNNVGISYDNGNVAEEFN